MAKVETAPSLKEIEGAPERAAAPDKAVDVAAAKLEQVVDKVLNHHPVTPEQALLILNEMIENNIVFGVARAAVRGDVDHADIFTQQEVMTVKGKSKAKKERDRGFSSQLLARVPVSVQREIVETLDAVLENAIQSGGQSSLQITPAMVTNLMRDIAQSLENAGAILVLANSNLSAEQQLGAIVKDLLVQAASKRSGVKVEDVERNLARTFEAALAKPETPQAARALEAEIQRLKLVKEREAQQLLAGEACFARLAIRLEMEHTSATYLGRLSSFFGSKKADLGTTASLDTLIIGLQELPEEERISALAYLRSAKGRADLKQRFLASDLKLIEAFLETGKIDETLVKAAKFERARLIKECQRLALLVNDGNFVDAEKARSGYSPETVLALAILLKQFEEVAAEFKSKEHLEATKAMLRREEMTREEQCKDLLNQARLIGQRIAALRSQGEPAAAMLDSISAARAALIARAREIGGENIVAVIEAELGREEALVRAEAVSKKFYELEYELAYQQKTYGDHKKIEELKQQIDDLEGHELHSQSAIAAYPVLRAMIAEHREAAKIAAQKSYEHTINVWGSVTTERDEGPLWFKGQDGDDQRDFTSKLSAHQFEGMQRICMGEERQSLYKSLTDKGSDSDELIARAAKGEFATAAEEVSRAIDRQALIKAVGPGISEANLLAFSESGPKAEAKQKVLALNALTSGADPAIALAKLRTTVSEAEWQANLEQYQLTSGTTLADQLTTRRAETFKAVFAAETVAEQRYVSAVLLQTPGAVPPASLSQEQFSKIQARRAAISAQDLALASSIDLAARLAEPSLSAEETTALIEKTGAIAQVSLFDLATKRGELLAAEVASPSAIRECTERLEAKTQAVAQIFAKVDPKFEAAVRSRTVELELSARTTETARIAGELAYQQALRGNVLTARYERDAEIKRWEIKAKNYQTAQAEFINANAECAAALRAQVEAQLSAGQDRAKELRDAVLSLDNSTGGFLGWGTKKDKVYAALKTPRDSTERWLFEEEFRRINYGSDIPGRPDKNRTVAQIIEHDFSGAEKTYALALARGDRGAALAADVYLKRNKPEELAAVFFERASFSKADLARADDFFRASYGEDVARELTVKNRSQSGEKVENLTSIAQFVAKLPEGAENDMARAAFNGDEVGFKAARFRNQFGFWNDKEREIVKILDEIAGNGYEVDVARINKFKAAIGKDELANLLGKLDGPERDFAEAVLADKPDRVRIDSEKARFYLREKDTEDGLAYASVTKHTLTRQDIAAACQGTSTAEERKAAIEAYAAEKHTAHIEQVEKDFEQRNKISLEKYARAKLNQEELKIFNESKTTGNLDLKAQLHQALERKEGNAVIALLADIPREDLAGKLQEYRQAFGHSLKSEIKKQLSGGEEFEALYLVRNGRPETFEQKSHYLHARVDHANHGWTGFTDIFVGSSRKSMQAKADAFDKAYLAATLDNKLDAKSSKKPSTEAERELERVYNLAISEGTSYRTAKAAAGAAVTEYGTMALAIGAGVLTGGATTSLWVVFAASTGGGLLGRVGSRWAFEGKDYETGLQDSISAIADGATTVLGVKFARLLMRAVPASRLAEGALLRVGQTAERSGIQGVAADGVTKLGAARIFSAVEDQAERALAMEIVRSGGTRAVLSEVTAKFGKETATALRAEWVELGRRILSQNIVFRAPLKFVEGAAIGGVGGFMQGVAHGTVANYKSLLSDPLGTMGRILEQSGHSALMGLQIGGTVGAIGSLRNRPAWRSKQLSEAQTAKALEGIDINGRLQSLGPISRTLGRVPVLGRLFRRAMNEEGVALLTERLEARGFLARGDIEDAILASQRASQRAVRNALSELEAQQTKVNEEIAQNDAVMRRKLNLAEGESLASANKDKINLSDEFETVDALHKKLEDVVSRKDLFQGRIDAHKAGTGPAPSKLDILRTQGKDGLDFLAIGRKRPDQQEGGNSSQSGEDGNGGGNGGPEVSGPKSGPRLVRDNPETAFEPVSADARGAVASEATPARVAAEAPAQPKASAQPQDPIAKSQARLKDIGEKLDQARTAFEMSGKDPLAKAMARDAYENLLSVQKSELARLSELRIANQAARQVAPVAEAAPARASTSPESVRKNLQLDEPLPTSVAEAEKGVAVLEAKLRDLQQRIEIRALTGKTAEAAELQEIFDQGMERLFRVSSVKNGAGAALAAKPATSEVPDFLPENFKGLPAARVESAPTARTRSSFDGDSFGEGGGNGFGGNGGGSGGGSRSRSVSRGNGSGSEPSFNSANESTGTAVLEAPPARATTPRASVRRPESLATEPQPQLKPQTRQATRRQGVEVIDRPVPDERLRRLLEDPAPEVAVAPTVKSGAIVSRPAPARVAAPVETAIPVRATVVPAVAPVATVATQMIPGIQAAGQVAVQVRAIQQASAAPAPAITPIATGFAQAQAQAQALRAAQRQRLGRRMPGPGGDGDSEYFKSHSEDDELDEHSRRILARLEEQQALAHSAHKTEYQVEQDGVRYLVTIREVNGEKREDWQVIGRSAAAELAVAKEEKKKAKKDEGEEA